MSQPKRAMRNEERGTLRLRGFLSCLLLTLLSGSLLFGFQWKYQRQQSRSLKTGQQSEAVVGNLYGRSDQRDYG